MFLKYALSTIFLISTIAAPIAYLNFLVIYHSIIFSFLSVIAFSSISAIISIYIDKLDRKEKVSSITSKNSVMDVIAVPLAWIFGFTSLLVVMPDINKNDIAEVIYLNISRIVFPTFFIITVYKVRKSMV